MDTGGLAQMTFSTSNNTFGSGSGLGVPGAGFASRGKGAQLKRLSVAVPPKVSSINEHETVQTPRTSRGHMLAGLRTAPKNTAAPASAPYNQQQHRFSPAETKQYSAHPHAGSGNGSYGQAVPHTAIGASFAPSAHGQYGMRAGQQIYSLTEQVLAPPPVQYDVNDGEHMDPSVLAQLMVTEAYLAQRQQELQRQLLQLTNSQFGGMNLGTPHLQRQASFPQTPATPQMSYYNQQLQNGVSPVPQEVPGRPGVYVVYNPLTGQYTYAMDPAVQQQQAQLANSPPPQTPSRQGSYNAEMAQMRTISPLTEKSSTPFNTRSISPPKKTPSPPADVTPLPPPSANAFRRGHKKNVPSAFTINTSATNVVDGPKSAFVRPVGMPMTPLTGTFGPGQARAGEHPVRQPRGPPPLEELVAMPTSKHEGSKNFATRQRRRALHSLVRASNERRSVARSGSSGSAGSITPISEHDSYPFNSGSDNESVHSGSSSASLSRKTSEGSLRAAAHGAIGGERRHLKDRLSAGSLSGGEEIECKPLPGQRKTPLLVLTSAAEKRKTGTMF